MTAPTVLRIDGEVENPMELSYDDLAALDASQQILDVSRLDPARKGDAVKLAALMQAARVRPSAAYIGLHASCDNFHASIPLDPVRDSAVLIYRLDGAPLEMKAGGPFRFFIPDHAACHTDEIDECANVKFVDHIEFTAEKGFDNRPEDDAAHQQLNRSQDNA